MINPNELRPGNIIKYTGKPYPFYPLVDGIVEVEEVLLDGVNRSQGDSTLYESNKLEGVPITSEILERMGFVDGVLYFQVLMTSIRAANNGTEVRYCDAHGNSVSRYYQYVHQLQNLYLTLTGEELSIKENA